MSKALSGEKPKKKNLWVLAIKPSDHQRNLDKGCGCTHLGRETAFAHPHPESVQSLKTCPKRSEQSTHLCLCIGSQRQINSDPSCRSYLKWRPRVASKDSKGDIVVRIWTAQPASEKT